MRAGAVDLEGDIAGPGLIELHTDNLEKHFSPRPGVKWPAVPAVMAHDTQIAAGGITTVFDSLSLGDVRGDTDRVQNRTRMVEAICEASERRMTRAEHRLHLRCEITPDDAVEAVDQWIDLPLVGLLSINDHTPGQRQFLDPSKLKQYYMGKFAMTEAQFEEFHARSLELHQRNAVKHRARDRVARPGPRPAARQPRRRHRRARAGGGAQRHDDRRIPDHAGRRPKPRATPGWPCWSARPISCSAARTPATSPPST